MVALLLLTAVIIEIFRAQHIYNFVLACILKSHVWHRLFQDGDWDLVNMQRLSKAVEDTAKDTQIAAADAKAVANSATDAAADPPAQAAPTPPVNVGPDASFEAPAQAVSKNPFDPFLGDCSGVDETKTSDEAVEKQPEPKATSPAVSKWHRELCSLAEMGFENTARNITLLEKHVTAPGNPGMERQERFLG